jgi:hypothetical protein
LDLLIKQAMILRLIILPRLNKRPKKEPVIAAKSI